jgi:hypothetical protein
MARDKEFQMFWANAEVIKPSIYAKPPVPVVVPKFLDRRPVYQAAAEMMERLCVVAFDLAGIDELLKLVRDDLALIDRGVAWCRYESRKGDSDYSYEKVCIDFKDRKDFLHAVARNWREVTWVAAASYLTRSEAKERFKSISGDSSERRHSVGGGLRKRPYSISCGVDQRSNTISGRMHKVFGGWHNFLSGGFCAAGTLRHVSSVMKTQHSRMEHFPPYRHLVWSDRMAAGPSPADHHDDDHDRKVPRRGTANGDSAYQSWRYHSAALR